MSRGLLWLNSPNGIKTNPCNPLEHNHLCVFSNMYEKYWHL
jgi:hypothetical protein